MNKIVRKILSLVLLTTFFLTAFSPSKGTWVKPSLTFADILDATTISDSEAEALTKDSSSLTEPPLGKVKDT